MLLQGANISQLERDIGSDQFPPNEHYFGLVNVSNVRYKTFNPLPSSLQVFPVYSGKFIVSCLIVNIVQCDTHCKQERVIDKHITDMQSKQICFNKVVVQSRWT